MHFNNCGNNGKLKRFFILLLAAFMVVSMAFMAACKDTTTPTDDTDDDNDTVIEETQYAFIKNGDFEDNYSTDYFPKTPKNWTSHGDTVNGETASKSGSKTGVISVNEDKFSALDVFDDTFKVANPNSPKATSLDDEKVKDHILMVYNYKFGAVKYKSQSISIPVNSYAKISVYVKTVGITAIDSNDHAGAYISLSESGNKNLFIVDGIDTQTDANKTAAKGESNWSKYVFYVEGSESAAKTVYAELGLGSGSAANTLAYTAGAAFFDDIELEFINKGEYQKSLSDLHLLNSDHDSLDDKYFYVNAEKQIAQGVYYNRLASENITATADAEVNNYAFSYNNLKNRNIKTVADLGVTTAEVHGSYFNNINASFDIESGRVASNTTTGAFASALANYPFVASDIFYLNNKKPSTQGIVLYEDTITPVKNIGGTDYSSLRIGVFVKTSNFDANGLNLMLLYRDSASTSTAKKALSFTDINTETGKLSAEDLAKQENLHIQNDGWTEYVFYIQAAKYATIEYSVEAWLGPQAVNALSIESFTKGFALFGETSITDITAAEFSSASTAANVKSVSFTTVELAPTAQIANGSFDKFATSEKAEDILNKPLSPLNWTGYFGGDYRLIRDKNISTVTATSVNDIAKGIINTKAANLANYVANSYFNSALSVPASDKLSMDNRLMIYNKNATSFGYVTPLKSLSAETYYEISVWVYSPQSTTNAFIYLTDSDGKVLTLKTEQNERELKQTVTSDSSWVQYSMFIRTGELSKQFRIELFNGSRDGLTTSTGTILFSDVYMNTITETVYNELTAASYTGPDKRVAFEFHNVDFLPEVDEVETPPEETPVEEEVKTPFEFPWAVISSLLVALALLFAVFAVAIKKFRKTNKERRRFTRVVKKGNLSYDRSNIKNIAKTKENASTDETSEIEEIDIEDDAE